MYGGRGERLFEQEQNVCIIYHESPTEGTSRVTTMFYTIVSCIELTPTTPDSGGPGPDAERPDGH